MTAAQLRAVLGRLYDVRSYAYGEDRAESRVDYIHRESISYIDSGATFAIAIQDAQECIDWTIRKYRLRPCATPPSQDFPFCTDIWNLNRSPLPPTTNTLN